MKNRYLSFILLILISSCNSDNQDSVNNDTDSDGIENSIDNCPNTPANENVDSNGCSESQLIDDDVVYSLNVKNGLYVERNIDYNNIGVVVDNHYLYANHYLGYKYHFGMNNLDFKYEYSISFYAPYNLNNEVNDFLIYQTAFDTNQLERKHINNIFNFNNNLMLWNGYKFTRPIITYDLFGGDIVMFPYKRIYGEFGVLDGIFETKLEYPDGDIIKSRLIIDYKNDGFIYIINRITLNDNIISNTVFTPISPQSMAIIELYSVESEEYLISYNPIGQFQPVFSAHFFNKNVYQ